MGVSAGEVELFERARGRLEAIAYRMLGSAGDAEDAVQDTFLRWQAADREKVATPEAWLTTVLTNVCRNQLASARVRRETYVGQWLPEPVLDSDRMLGPAETVEQRESVSIAVLTLMERLSPNERVVYVLREAFGYSHGEIARMVDLSESNCQQIYRRARQHITAGRARAEADAGARGGDTAGARGGDTARALGADERAAREIVAEFLAAALSGETEPLVRLLTGDAVSVADGGGQVPARKDPVVGALAIARYLRGLLKPNSVKRFLAGGSVTMHGAVVNGGPAVLAVVGDRVVGVIALQVTVDGVAALHIQANPDKLGRFSRRWFAAGPGRPLVAKW